MFISDNPIISTEEDILGRTKFSFALGETILSLEDSRSIVIGLYGAWGAGKSSVINLMREKIRKIKGGGNAEILFLHFNPWNFSEQNQLITSFFNELANKLEFTDKSEQARSIAKKLKLYSSFLSATESVTGVLQYVFPISFAFVSAIIFASAYTVRLREIAMMGGCVFAVLSVLSLIFKKTLLSVGDFFLEKSSYSKKTLEEIKDDLSAAILERGKKILIVIDDVDRLTPKEMKQIFQLVKINADFPNTIYLLPFERKIIEENLSEQKGISGKEYLKKIVQVDFDLPDAQKNRIYKFLFKQLDLIIKDIPENEWDQTYWGNVFHSGFSHFFQSLRDVKRFINSLNFNFRLVKIEGVPDLNPVDFIAIEAIRVFEPDFYYSMRLKKSLFTSTDSSSYSRDEKDKKRKEEIEGLLSSVNPAIRNMIFEIFPQIKGLYDNCLYGLESQRVWERERRVCASTLFERYFILDVPEGEIAKFEADAVLNLTTNHDGLVKELKRYVADGRIANLLDLLEGYVERFDLKNAETITTALLDIADDLPEDRAAFSYIDSNMRLMRIIYHYLKRFKDSHESEKVLKKAILNSTGLYGCVHNIGTELQGIEKESSGFRLITKESAQEFKNICVSKIAAFKDSPKLRRSTHLSYLLLAWSEWGGGEAASDFARTLLQKDEDLISLVKAFLHRSYSKSSGDYISKEKKRINYKGMARFVKLEEVKQRVGELNLNILNGEEKEAIELYLRDYDKRDREIGFFDDD